MKIEEDIITSKVYESLRYAYQRCVDNGFSFNKGGFSTDGIERLGLAP